MNNKSSKHTKVLILGSGPAGYTAAIYAARALLKPILVFGSEPGGQLTTTTDVENFPGFAKVIQGPWLMEEMKGQAQAVGTEMIQDHIKKVDLSKKPFSAHGDSGQIYTADSIIISTGAQARWLNLESEQKFRGFGVSACATCDGFFFKEKEVAVVGGGNAAVEEAMFLTKFASKVHLIHRRNELRAEKLLQEKLKAGTGGLGGTELNSVQTAIARDFNDALVNSPVDLITANMTIMGDPYYIADSGMGNYSAGTTPIINITEDGTMDYQSSEVDVLINF